MSSEMRKVTQAIRSAGHAGLVSGTAFFILGTSAAFLTNGEGHAPGFTHFMLALVDIPVQLLGLSKQGTLFPASIFWGLVSGLAAFFYRLACPRKNGEGA